MVTDPYLAEFGDDLKMFSYLGLFYHRQQRLLTY